MTDPSPDPVPTPARSPVQIALLAALVLALPTLLVPWVMDDWFILMTNAAWLGDESVHWWPISATQVDPLGLPSSFCFSNGNPAETSRWIAEGVFPWWTDPDLRLCFWRPLASVTHLFDQALAGASAGLAHVHSVLWYLLLCAGVARFWDRRLGGKLAVLVALVYAVDDAHAFPVAWVANRNALMAAAFGAWSMVFHDQGRRWPALGLLALALLSGEAGVGAIGLVVAWQLVYGEGSTPRRLLGAAPAVGLGLVWLVAYKLGGFGATASGLYIDPVGDPVRWMLTALAHAPVVSALMLAPMPADLLMADPSLLPLILGQSMVVLALVAWGVRRLWPSLEPAEQQAMRFGALGFGLAVLPTLSTVPTSRLVTLPGIAGAVVLAILVRAGLRERKKDKVDRDRRVFGLGMFMLVFHLVLSPLAWPALTAYLVGGDTAARTQLKLAAVALEGAEEAVLLVSSDPALTVYLPDAAVAMGLSMPHWTTLSQTPGPHELKRTGKRTLELKALDEPMNQRPFAALYRSDRAEFIDGQVIVTDAYTVRVLETQAGQPVRVAVVFARDLDDPQLRLLRWDGEALVPVAPPSVGSAETLEWAPGLTGM